MIRYTSNTYKTDKNTYSVPNQSLFIFLFPLLLILAIVSGYFGYADIGEWRLTTFYISYETEFLKRGLIGEFLRFITETPTTSDVFILNIATLASLTCIYTYAILKLACKSYYTNAYQFTNTAILFFSILVISNSATVQHFAFNIGRYDFFNFIISAFIVLHINNNREKTSILLLLALNTIMILIHEASVIMFTPAIFCYWWIKSQAPLKKILSSYILLLTSGVIISKLGLPTQTTALEHRDLLISKYNIQPVTEALDILYKGSFSHNMFLSYISLFNLMRVYQHIIFFTGMAPTLLVIAGLIRTIWKKLHVQEKCLVLSTLSPLSLYLIAFDYFRWWAMSIILIFLVIAYFLSQAKTSELILYYINSKKWLILIAVSFSFIFGPIGASNSFECYYEFNNWIKSMH